jgi:murein DD-endopeptidase MepM/ murein hydrolase activator NlpD
MKEAKMGAKRFAIQKWALVALGFACLFSLTVPLWDAYQVQRPITLTGGEINNFYLYGEYLSGLGVHYGIDFPYPLDTPVFAVTSGTVVDLKEDCPDNQTYPCPRIAGNYVSIRHDRRSWDRIRIANSDVYSLYCHLSYDSVIPGIGAHVNAGDHIADVDQTGSAEGHHLHLRVSLNSSADSTSRNPEVWLQPYSYGTNTGTVVGKLTDSSGNPVGNSTRIYGLTKPPFSHYYEYNITYSYVSVNPDDILVENWATTDVNPGTYYPGLNGLRTCDQYGGNCVPYGDEASYTVVANEVTYINLYPYFLPDVSASPGTGSAFRSNIAVRNDNETRTNQANTTYFDSSAWGKGQRTDYIQSKVSTSFTPPGTGWVGSGVVVGSARSGVLDVAQSGYETYAYTGVPVRSDLGLAQAKTLYIPNYANNYWNWRSLILVQNTGRAPDTVKVTYYDTSGNSQCQTSAYLDPWQTATLDPRACFYAPVIGAVRLSTVGGVEQPDQPIAAVVIQYIDSQSGGPRRSAYNAFSAGSNALYLPDLLRNFCGMWNSSFWVHNTQSSSTNVTIYYNKRNGDAICYDTIYPLPANATREFYQGSVDPNHTCLWNYSPADWRDGMIMATIVADTGTQIVAAVHQDYAGGDDFQSYNAAIAGKTTLVIPQVVKSSAWDVDIIVRDASASNEAVNVYFWNSNGSSAGQLLNQPLPAWGFLELHDLIPSFTGSVVIVRNGTGRIAAVCNRLRLGMPSLTDAAASFGTVEP